MAAHNPSSIDMDWLMSKIQPIPFSGCWVWDAAPATGGYAQVMIAGRRWPAHRVAYNLRWGDVPDGLEIDHLCRVRCCVNPDHLEAVTHSANVLRGDVPRVTAARNKTAEMRAMTVARHSARTRCKQGHELTDRNTYTNPKTGQRFCRLCAVAYSRAYRARRL